MYQTKNDLALQTRTTVVDLLNALLADANDLQSQAKEARWNVKGPSLLALRQLFGELHDRLAGYGDSLAERIVSLGGRACATVRRSAATSTLPEYPISAVDGAEHIEAFSRNMAVFAKALCSAIDATAELHDLDTEGLLVEISRGADHWLGVVEGHGAPVVVSSLHAVPVSVTEMSGLLPEHALAIYREAFARAKAQGRDRATAEKSAWRAVRRTYEVRGERWVPRDSESW